jgi:hypothetical protein
VRLAAVHRIGFFIFLLSRVNIVDHGYKRLVGLRVCKMSGSHQLVS